MSELLELIQDETLRGDAALSTFKSVDDLAKSYVQTKAMVGKKGVILPGEGAKDEEWEPVYNQLGRPEKSDAYKVPQIELPKGQQLRADMLKEFNEFAHKAGLTQKQYEKALTWRVQTELGEFAAQQKAHEEAEAESETALRSAWKDKYDANNQAFEKMVKTFGKDKAETLLKKYGKDAEFKMFMSEIIPHFSEAALGELGYTPGGNQISAEQAKQKISEIRNDPKHPFNILNHPEHDKAVSDVSKLYELAHPGKRKI